MEAPGPSRPAVQQTSHLLQTLIVKLMPDQQGVLSNFAQLHEHVAHALGAKLLDQRFA